ncbi:hypothetical protein N0V90_009757 [Kalmusia sp. IMI 367209]|nr:hypothetical protein N0V90_009757 [Kalmusia sp. IMI 367209]
MCRIEEKVYIGSDGRSRTFQDTFQCDRARRRGKLCSKPEKRTREYIGAPPIARDDASSPASNNPPTPTGTGGYVVEERRPSSSGRRPSLKPGSALKPGIVIEIGTSRRDKDKKYPRTYISKTYKRSSAGSTASNEVAVESPGSDASYPIRTGYPETTVSHSLPFEQPHGYTTRHVVPQSHRHNTSTSSVTTSQTPSLYTTSETEPESPLGRHAPEYPRTIVHNTRPAPSSPATSRGPTASMQANAFRTRIEVPPSSSRDTSSSRENAGDYSDVVDLYASSHGHTSSNASSSRAAAPEITDRAIDRERERRRKRKEEEKRQQQEEEDDRRLEEELKKATEQAEQAKQVRFAELDTGRYEERDRLRKEQKFAESERQRAEERERERQRKKELDRRTAKEPEKRATKKPDREKTQPPTRDFNKKRPGGHSRRNSMTQADIDERDRLLLQEKLQMSLEREAAEQRERDERAAELRQQQYATRPQQHSTPSYHESRPPASDGKRRGSVSMNPPPVGSLGRTNSTRRASVIQPNPPVLTPLATSFPQQQSYSTRPPSSQTNAPHYTAREQLPSARYSPSQLGGPFAQPAPRNSNTKMENNPFAAPSTRPIHPSHPPVPVVHQPVVHHYPPGATTETWDTRAMQNNLPSYPPGQPAQYAQQGHSRAQQATRTMAQAYGNQVEDEWR